MALTDVGPQRLDDRYQLIVVLFNSSPKPQSLPTGLKGVALQLHPVQAASHDPVVKTSAFDPASGTFTVPGRTAAVFVAAQAPGDVAAMLTALPVAAAPEATATPAATSTLAPTSAPTAAPTATSMPPAAAPTATTLPTKASPSGPSGAATAAGALGLLALLVGGFLFLRRAFLRQ